MKLSKIIVSALLVCLIIGGWGACILGIGDGDGTVATDNYKECITKAEDYMDRSLYQKAAMEYASAAALKNKESDWASLLEACQCRYEEDESYLSEYLTYAEKASRAYENNASFALKAAELAMENGDYSEAYACLERTYAAGVEDEELENLYLQVKYSFIMDRTAYDEIRCASNDCFAVSDGTVWGQISTSGKKQVAFQYDVCGSVGSEGIYVYSYENGSGLTDLDGIIQGKLDFTVSDAGIYAEGVVPISNGTNWSYYDQLGDKKIGGFLAAGTFQNGRAAVKTEKGWCIIDDSGKKRSKNYYEEIRLNGDGTYLRDGVMLAKVDGNWHLYDKNEKKIGEFSCDDVDVITGKEAFAFQRDSKWGFCDLDGNEIIAPEYENARSFSNGLAGVCVDDKWGFINIDNKIVMECLYLDVNYFTNEKSCLVKTIEDGWQMIHLRIED